MLISLGNSKGSFQNFTLHPHIMDLPSFSTTEYGRTVFSSQKIVIQFCLLSHVQDSESLFADNREYLWKCHIGLLNFLLLVQVYPD